MRTAEFRLEPREDGRYAASELWKTLRAAERPFDQCLAALGLSWRKRVEAGIPLQLQALDFGEAMIALFPAESYVEYQLNAKELRPEMNLVCCGYGECGPGYIPIEKAWEERDSNLTDWCWVPPGSEARMKSAIRALLEKS